MFAAKLCRIAICAIVKDEAPYIKEWVEFHASQGVSEFLLYDNGSGDGLSDIVASIRGGIKPNLVPWDNRISWIHTQRAAYSDAIRRLFTRVEFVAFIDVDEFLYSPEGLQLPTVLSGYSPTVGAVGVNQLVFGSSGAVRYSSEPVLQRFTRRANNDHPESRWYKSIVRPDRISYPETAHVFRLRGGDYVHADGTTLTKSNPPGTSVRICNSCLLLNHYMLKSREEFDLKRARWRGTSLEDRYDEAYFAARDAFANSLEDRRLAKLFQPSAFRDRPGAAGLSSVVETPEPSDGTIGC
jgi:Glycosyltransferase family 92